MRFGLCFVVMLVLALIDLRVWFVLAYPIYGLAFMLLLAVPVIGHHSLGATRWIQAGPISVQPSEIMKIGLVLALARFYHGVSAKDAKLSWKLLIPAALIGAPTLLVAHEPDLGTAILIAATGACIMIMAGLTWRILALGAVFAVPAVAVFVQFVMKSYQRDRILTFLNPESDPSGNGYHILQAKIALGSGGFFGKGFGLGTQSRSTTCRKSRQTSSSPPSPRSSASWVAWGSWPSTPSPWLSPCASPPSATAISAGCRRRG